MKMYWEIVELEDGQIALRQVDDQSEPMVTIKFSPEAQARLNDRHIDVARAMFTAGMHFASNMDHFAFEDDDTEFAASDMIH